MSVANPSSSNSYDDFAYPGYPRAATHPYRLAVIADLFGITPPPVETARVLEIGCGDGGNLLPMAVSLPKAELLGIDFSDQQISRGQELLSKLPCKNIRLTQMNVMDFPADAGNFDYIIAHGVFSWVPEPVREKILAICRDHLSPNGIAYIDYNTNPGNHVRDMFRNMMKFHTAQFTDPQQKINQSKALLDMLLKANPGETLYNAILKSEIKRLSNSMDASIYHDELSEVNVAFYFHEFLDLVKPYGLQYLGEADVHEMHEARYPKEIAEKLATIRDQFFKEQYLDFLQNRTFRQTLLCRTDVKLNRIINPETLDNKYLRCQVKAESSTPDLTSSKIEKFVRPNNAYISLNHPAAKATLQVLSENWPATISFKDLCNAAVERSSTALDDKTLNTIREVVLKSFGLGFLDLHLQPLPFTLEISQTPTASPLARLHASLNRRVSTLDHKSIQINNFAAALLQKLDGNHSIDSIVAFFKEPIASGQMTIRSEKENLSPEKAVEKLPEIVLSNIREFAKLALLIS